MMAVLSDQTSILENAALEPEIDDLISFFNEAGARIRREGTSIIVDGVEELKQQKPYTIAGDRNEAVTYAVLALTTLGDITLEGIPVHLLEKFDQVLDDMGAGIEKKSDTSVRYFYKGPLKAMSIETGPHPGFMTDWQPPMAVLFTQAAGESMIHERLFENRFSYVSELKKLGADIEYANPDVPNPKEFYEFNYEEGQTYQQAISIKGPQKLHNGVMSIADLRAGATLAIAALIAPGESIVNGASHMERGYEDFIAKVTALGGDITKA
jgi:UDP-N-acetylglucosamine 1-carboxyvinyltransferase